MEAAISREKQDRDDVKNAFAQLESAVEHMDDRHNKPETKSEHDPVACYSTRGRPQEESLEAAGDLLSIAKDLGGSDHPTRARESFLIDTLSEKEIRTRTRVLPNLEGMHGLRKSEIKSDLSIARGDKPPKKRKGRDIDDDADDATMDTTDEDPSVYRTVAIGKHTFAMPSSSFLPPPANPVSSKRPSPKQVDSIVAYNPPRPPDSIGAKKEHRLRHWERRPEDIESDLVKYRKTVQKISDELRNTEIELEAITTADNLLRRHFINHIHNLNQEIFAIQDEMSVLQQECLDLCGTSARTRTRGSAKAGSVMRDILLALKAKGTGMMDYEATQAPGSVPVTGDGGLHFSNFRDWDRSTELGTCSLASTWLSREVETPYGTGTVVATVLPDRHMPPRVEVNLTYGKGYFDFTSLKHWKMDTPASMTDEQLANRWRRLIASAKSLGAVIDTAGMTTRSLNQQRAKGNSDEPVAGKGTNALVPFGSDVLPTEFGRGSFSYKASYEELVGEARRLLSSGQGVLGVETNPGVRQLFVATENQQVEKLKLKAKALHLRNKLIRQHRTRLLNEKTYAATKERAAKVESLVDEMRSDLTSLKCRLDSEMRDIGISDERAESILSKYYESLDSRHQGDASPPKRQRRSFPLKESEKADHQAATPAVA